MAVRGVRHTDLYNAGIKGYIFVLVTVVSLILAGLTNPIFSILAFGVCFVFILLTSNENSMCLMFFFLPFANIFKVGPETTSLFTFLVLLLTAKMIFTKRYISRSFICIWILLFIIQIIGCKGNYSLLIKQASILLFVYGYFNSCKRITKEITLNLAIGLIISSTLGLFTKTIPGLDQYMRVVKAYDVSRKLNRFTALYSDPNYLSVNLILIIIAIIILVEYKELKQQYLFIPAILLAFGISTISKSFFLMIFVVAIFWLLIKKEKNNYKSLLLFLIAFLIIIALVSTGRITAFDNVVKRIIRADDISTGRITIFSNYLKYILDNIECVFFGFGIGAEFVGRNVPHNTLIDFLYYYGIFGSLIFVMGIRKALRFPKTNKKIGNTAPIICISVMFMALSALQMFDFPFLIILLFDYLRYPFESIAKK